MPASRTATRKASGHEPSAEAQLAALPLSPSLRALAQRGELRRYAKGTVLIEEGDVGQTLYLIVSGRLRAYSSNSSGREITYGHYGPGEYLGEMSLDGGPRAASVITTEASWCAVITRHTLNARIAEDPALAFELLAKVIRRARAATLTARQLALNDVYGRLKALLEELAEPAQADGRRCLAERITHLELAQRVGCTREMVSKVMKDLETGGWLEPGPPLVLKRSLPARW
jgi:CRP/FNR family transcriptional regulator, cyclic AMP receptor protein